MSNESTASALESIAAVLEQNGVEYLVIGGQAEYLFGGSRVTFDVDICYKRTPENFIKFAAALKQLNVGLRGAPDGLPFIVDAQTLRMGNNFTFTTKFGDFDALGYVEPLGDYASVEKNAETYAIGDLPVRTISLEDLLRVKRHINRSKDQESIAQLLAIKRLRDEGKANP